MPGFKIADGYVSVTPDDDGFEEQLRAQVDAATADLKAKIKVEVDDGSLDEAAEDLKTSLESRLPADGEEAESFWAQAFSRNLSSDAESMADDFGDDFAARMESAVGRAMEDPDLLAPAGSFTQRQLDNILGPESGITAGAGAMGKDAAAQLREDFENGLIETGPPDVMLPNGQWASELKGQSGVLGRLVAEEYARQLEAGNEDEADALADSFAQSLTDASEKGASESGKSAEQSGEGMGMLMMVGIGAAAALGAPLVLAATGAVFTGIAAYALKSNKVIAADYTQLGKTAETALTQAAAPLAGVMNQNLQTLDSSIKALQPDLDGLFANLGPDITSVTGGLTSFASNVIPGVSTALANSHADVQGFANGLGELGTGVGGFFTGLTRDSQTTGAGLQTAFGLIGNTVSTLGTVLGSASTAISADLMAIAPAANFALTAIDKLASPETVGAVLGAFSVSKFSGPISSGLQSVSDGFLNVASKADGAGGLMGKVGSAAESASGGFSTMADVMGGPWGIAIGAGIGLASGLAGSMFNASKASDALTLSQSNLTQATEQDNDTAGAATAALVAQSFATDGLSKSAAAAGVSASTWTQAVLGSTTAQQQVLSAVDKTNQATQNQAAAVDNVTHSTGKFSDEQKDAQEAAQGSAAATNKLTVQNQQLVNSLAAQTKQVATSIAQQTTYEQAMAALTNTEQLFNASLTAGYKSMVASAQASALTTVANLNLGTSNYALNTSLDQTLTTYQEASTTAGAYNSVLQALNGTTMGVDQATNSLDQQMLTAKTSFAANKESLDQNTQAGISDRQALVSAAQAITAMGVAQEQATGSVSAGNATIQQQITKFVAATGATGTAKAAIIAYLEQIAKIPASTSTTVNVNTGPAMTALNALQGVMASDLSMSNSVGSSASALLHTLPKHAAGGNVYAGTASIVGDGGQPEVFVAPTDGYIYPSVQAGQQAIAQHNAQVTASAQPGAPTSSTVVHQHFTGSALPSIEQRATMRRELAPMVGIG